MFPYCCICNYLVILLVQLKMLESVQLDAPLNCWLKINTGMHRLGIAPEFYWQQGLMHEVLKGFVSEIHRSLNIEHLYADY